MILHITEKYKPYIGGSAKRISEILEKQILISKSRIVVVTLDGNLYKQNEEINGVEVIRTRNLFQMLRTCINICKKEHVEVIHAHNFRFGFVGMLLKLFVKKRVDFVLEMHSIYRTSSKLKEIVSKQLFKIYDKIIVLSEASKEYVPEVQTPVYTLINGIDKISSYNNGLDKSISNEIENKISKKIVLGYIGTLYDWQGTDNIIWLESKLRDLKKDVIFLIVGDGPEANKMKEKCKNAIFTGAVNFEDVPMYMKLIDIYLILRPSTLATETAIPLKVFEAMSDEKLILASNVGGLKEVLKDKVNAILYPKDSLDEMLNRAKYCIDNYMELKSIGRTAKKDICMYPTWEEQAKKLLEIYSYKEGLNE